MQSCRMKHVVSHSPTSQAAAGTVLHVEHASAPVTMVQIKPQYPCHEPTPHNGVHHCIVAMLEEMTTPHSTSPGSCNSFADALLHITVLSFEWHALVHAAVQLDTV
jgi:hypothetical protein